METVITTLDKRDFLVEKEAVPQTILYFSRESDLPLAIVLLVDTSNSEPCAFGGP